MWMRWCQRFWRRRGKSVVCGRCRVFSELPIINEPRGALLVKWGFIASHSDAARAHETLLCFAPFPSLGTPPSNGIVFATIGVATKTGDLRYIAGQDLRKPGSLWAMASQFETPCAI